jgi:DNA-binding NtrC family response regulator
MKNILIINSKITESSDLTESLKEQMIPFESSPDVLSGLSRAHEQQFDVIILDSRPTGMQIDQVIRLFKRYNPYTKIIVRTDVNSRQLEAKARKEPIYYYHVNSFGLQDLMMAISTALQIQQDGASKNGL